MNDIVVIKGLSPKFNLGIQWDAEGVNKILLATEYERNITALGKMPMTMENFDRIINFNWVCLEQTEDKKWKPKELNWEDIPRQKPSTQKPIDVLGTITKGSEDDGLLF